MDVRLFNRSCRLSLLLCLVLCVPPVVATTNSSSLKQQRTLFVEAEKALKNDNQQRYKKLKGQLTNYPLLPYLEYEALKRDIGNIDSRTAERFLSNNTGAPLATSFRRNWLDELAKRKQWWAYEVFYKPDMGISRKCHHLTALLDTGRPNRAFRQVPDIWLSGNSRPKACDPILDAWKAAGKLTQTLVWQRIELAIEKGNTKLAKYLSQSLTPSNRQWYDYWLKVRSDPETHLDHTKSAPKPINVAKIWAYGIKRFARKDINKALQLWNRHADSLALSADQKYETSRYLSLRMRRHNPQRAIQLFDTIQPRGDDDSYIEQRLRFAVSEGDWSALLRWLPTSPESIQQKERWQYWRAQALMSSGQKEQATEILKELAKQRSYHGFLAADGLDLPYNLNHSPVKIDQDTYATITNVSGLKRARELIALDRRVPARREWYYATRNMSHDELQAAAKLAQTWKWHNQAIFTLAKTGYWEDLELRFPIVHKKHIDNNASLRNLDNAWVFAVIRQESAFDHHAKSRVGALGLMQLMPNTAKHVARKIKHKRPRQSELLNPKTNITFGTAYLREVFDQLDNHQVLATAAYNAGPHRVKSWLPKKEIDAARWIEAIPFTETRLYTQSVMSYAIIYEHRLGKPPTRITQRLAPIKSKQLILAQR